MIAIVIPTTITIIRILLIISRIHIISIIGILPSFRELGSLRPLPVPLNAANMKKIPDPRV